MEIHRHINYLPIRLYLVAIFPPLPVNLMKKCATIFSKSIHILSVLLSNWFCSFFFLQLLEGECFPCADAKQCSSMGYYADKSAGRGIMYLATREEEPFCGMFIRCF